MKKINATLVILTRNEIKGLKAKFNEIPIDKITEVFAIDYKSTDGTVEFLKKNKVRVIPQTKKGRAEAFRMASREAKHENIVFFSPDGNEDPELILPLIEWIEKEYDMAIASRFMKGSKAEDEGFFAVRGFGNRAFTVIANILFRGRLTDSINGFRAVKKSKFWELNPDTEGFGIEFQISIRALKKKFKIKEIPTTEGERIGGMSTAHTFSTGWLFIKIILREIWLWNRYKVRKS